jgi:sugar phosphate isomerase/epimerase
MFKNLAPESLGISGRDREVIELTLSHGFKGLDLDLVDLAEQVASQGMERASRLITSSRLKIGSFPLPVRLDADPEGYQADLERLPALAQIAEQMHCTRATATIEPGSDVRPYHQNFELYCRRIVEVAGLLAARKIRLGLGFLAPIACREGRAFQFIQSFDELLLLLRSINAPNVGVVLDTWHWHVGGGKIESIRSLDSDKLVSVVLSDAVGDSTPHDARLESRRLPGEGGVIDNVAVLATLAELRYDGPVAPAADPSQFAGASREKIVKMAGAALDQVWKAAGLSASGRLAAVSGR